MWRETPAQQAKKVVSCDNVYVSRVVIYAPITIMPHPPGLVVGGDFGGLTPAEYPLAVALALYGEFVHLHICVVMI